MPPKIVVQEGGSDPTFFKGSFLIFLIFLPCFALIIITLLLSMQYKQLRAFISPHPMELATVPKSPEAEAMVLTKLHGFFAVAGSDTLSLSVEEINHLIRTSKTLSGLDLDYHMDLQDTFLVARNSLPATHLQGILALLTKVLRVKGYLNSEMKGYASVDKGQVNLIPVSATMNGIDAPMSVLNRKGGVDPAEWVDDKDFYAQASGHLAAIKVRNGHLLLIKHP